MLRDRERTFSLILAMVLGGCASVPQEDQSFRSVGTSVDDRTTERYLRREIIAMKAGQKQRLVIYATR